MMRALTAAVTALSMLLLSAGGPQVGATANDGRLGATTVSAAPRTASLDAVAVCVSLTAALEENAPLPAGLLHPDGCYVWQQPGVALVPTALWLANQETPELWLDKTRLGGLLKDLANYSWDDPPAAPREPQEGSAAIPPQVYLLDAARARARLAGYDANYDSWARLNSADEQEDAPQSEETAAPAFEPFMPVDDAALAVDFAVVYLTADGPLEFYLQRAADGRLYVRHVIHFSYFSA